MLAGLFVGLVGSQLVKEVHLEIRDGRFTTTSIHIPAGAVLTIKNHDSTIYTVESPGTFAGDVLLEARSQATVKPLHGGQFFAMIEERPDSEVNLSIESEPNPFGSVESPIDTAKAKGLQPLDNEREDPSYGAITQFDLTVTGQAERQQVLIDLYRLQEELSEDRPPSELAPYFSDGEWTKLKPTISMVTGLGPGSYQAKRFGAAVARTLPASLSKRPDLSKLGINVEEPGQRDIFVRVLSESHWFNLRLCRLVWKRLEGRIAHQKLEWGYKVANGRSPILDGFYDGTSNPSGKARTQAIYAADQTSILALYKISFDEYAFSKATVDDQQHLIGREKASGKTLKLPVAGAHKIRASDGHSIIVRMPLIFDDGERGTGLLFLSVQNQLTPLRSLLERMTASRGGSKDQFMKYMHFESAAYYVIPPSPKGGYPGTLRKNAFTFGS